MAQLRTPRLESHKPHASYFLATRDCGIAATAIRISPSCVSLGGLDASGLRSLPKPWEDRVTPAFSDHELEQLVWKLMNLQEGQLWGE